MKKVLVLASVAVIALVGPVQAKKPNSHGKSNAAPGHTKACTPKAKNYDAQGTLVSGSLTKNSDGTYSGTLTVHVAHVNAPSKSDKNTDQTYTLTNAKVHLAKGVDPTALVAGDRVKVHGKRTHLKKKCDSSGFTPTTTIKSANIRAPKSAQSAKGVAMAA
jgi:hypothetical protein